MNDFFGGIEIKSKIVLKLILYGASVTHPTSCFLEISNPNGYGNYHEEIKTENEKMIFGQTSSKNFEIITQIGCNKKY